MLSHWVSNNKLKVAKTLKISRRRKQECLLEEDEVKCCIIQFYNHKQTTNWCMFIRECTTFRESMVASTEYLPLRVVPFLMKTFWCVLAEVPDKDERSQSQADAMSAQPSATGHTLVAVHTSQSGSHDGRYGLTSLLIYFIL